MDDLVGLERGDVTDAVRAIASERGVTERTAWRWLARGRRDGFVPPKERFCERCGRRLPEGATMRRRFCTDSCRALWHQNGARAGAAMDSQSAGRSETPQERQKRERQLAALHDLIDWDSGAWPKSSELEPEEVIRLGERLAGARRIVLELVEEALAEDAGRT